jgi:transcriptional regulator with XRE-family HTH domain
MSTIRRSDFVPQKTYAELTPGDAVRIARELSEMTQAELATTSGITQSAISAIETGTATLGADRALRIGEALGVHPGVLLFPMWKPKVLPKRKTASLLEAAIGTLAGTAVAKMASARARAPVGSKESPSLAHRRLRTRSKA